MTIRDERIIVCSMHLKILKYLIFFTTLTVYLGTGNAISNNVSNLVKEACLGGEMYGSRILLSFPEMSCCKSCELDQICIERKTCCDDRWRHIKDFQPQVCLPRMSKRHRKRGAIILHGDNMYLVRAHCPSSYFNDVTRYKCEQDNQSTLEDIPFVSSRNGDIIYKNRHCAVCHGETNPIVWKLYFDQTCIRRVFLPRYYSDPFQNASMINEKLMKSCTLYFERPDIALVNWKSLQCTLDGDLISNKVTAKLAPGSIEEELNNLCLNDKSKYNKYLFF